MIPHFLDSLWGWAFPIFGVIAVAGAVLFKYAGSVRDLVGLRKDALETEKLKNELEEQRSRIQTATQEDIRAYDPRSAMIYERARVERRISAQASLPPAMPKSARGRTHYLIWFALCVLVLLAAIGYILFLR